MNTHVLKCWPGAFDAIAEGTKRFEWRWDDRDFSVGDVLVLRWFDPNALDGSGSYIDERGLTREQRAVVTYILRDQFGVPPGYCVMSIEPEGAAGRKDGDRG